MKKKCKKYNIVMDIPVFSIWKKLHFSNEFTYISQLNIYWKLSSRFIFLLGLLWPLYGIVLILFYMFYLSHMILDTYGYLFMVGINFIIILLPIILIDILLVFMINIECKTNQEIGIT